MKKQLTEMGYHIAPLCGNCYYHDNGIFGDTRIKGMKCTITDSRVSPKGICNYWKKDE